MDSKTVSQMVGQMLIFGFKGTSAIDNPVKDDIEKGIIGGIYLSDKDLKMLQEYGNIQSPGQLKTLIGDLKKDSPSPLMVCIDQEGFGVNRLRKETGFEDYFQDRENFLNPDKNAVHCAQVLQEVGVNVNFAPVLDLNLNPHNPIIGKRGRSVSADPLEVFTYAGRFIRAMNEHSVFCCLKHFPGHGSALTDTHETITDVTSVWSPEELKPYDMFFQDGFEQGVMSCHIINGKFDKERPATLSYAVMTELLRNKMGFRGLVFSDDMMMNAVSSYYTLEESLELAVKSGVDILTFSNNSYYDRGLARKVHQIMVDLTLKEKIPFSFIEDSYNRIMKLKSCWSL